MEQGHSLSGRLFSYIGGGILGLENPQKHPHMMAYPLPPTPPPSQQTQMNPNPNPKPKPQMENSDEDSSFDGKRKSMSQWHRMKWTDSMVRLLIMAVFYIGDETGSEFGSEKKKPGQLQKKGKWKSVSKAMMEKGFCVSPQQCEDKFNDLNKRYKRVNEILGKGTACKVVENQSLLETMDHISPKMKDEVRKLLNSKHLFFREMCAYHNTCGHGSVNQPPIDPPPHSVPTPSPPSCSMVQSNSRREHHEFDTDCSDTDPDSDANSESDEERALKRVKTTGGISSNTLCALPIQQLKGDLTSVLQDGSKSSWEKKKWVMTQLGKLEEQGVKFQYQSLEIEKQRMKWMKFSGKKEREMDRSRIENERKRLENERMVLLLRQKEIELFMIQQRPSNLSSVSG